MLETTLRRPNCLTLLGTFTLALLFAGCAASHDRVAVYSNVTGVCFAARPEVKHQRFPQYPLHESSVTLTTETLDELLSGLEVAGLFEDDGKPLPAFAVPPMAFHICAASGDRVHEVTYFYKRGHTVPESYLKLLERLVPQPHPAALRKFLNANREF